MKSYKHSGPSPKIAIGVLILFIAGISLFLHAVVFYQPTATTVNKRSESPIPKLVENVSAEESQNCIKNAKVDFFMYHYIRENDPHDNTTTKDLSVDPANFREHMKVVRELANQKKIALLSEDELLTATKSNCYPAPIVWIFTSDDGWSDMADNLMPIATEFRVPFELGIILNKIGTPGFISESDLKNILENPFMHISSHSLTHRSHKTLTPQEEEHELCESKRLLEQKTGKSVRTYIYPTGAMSSDSRRLAKFCGYDMAWSTGFGTAFRPENPDIFGINRIRIRHDTLPSFYTRYAEIELKGLKK